MGFPYLDKPAYFDDTMGRPFARDGLFSLETQVPAEKPPNGPVPIQRVTLTAPAVIGFIVTAVVATTTVLGGFYTLDERNANRVASAKSEIKSETDGIKVHLTKIQQEVADHRHLEARIERMSARVERLETMLIKGEQ